MSRYSAVAILGLAAIGVGGAQPTEIAPALRFKWQAGQTLLYKVVQQTSVTETSLDEKTEKPATTEARTNLALTKKWIVTEVDAAGTATLEMQIVEMKNEIHQPDGTTIARDSSNPEHAKEMADYLNKTIVVVRVDRRGQLVEVKETKPGSAVRLRAELPFRLTLPEFGPTVGQSWDRTFALKLDPPLGTGESYDFVQKYACRVVDAGIVAVGVETSLKAPPKTTGERVPLVPMLWTGTVYFDAAAGKYRAAHLTAKSELVNHLGEGSKFVYESSYNEDAIEK